MKFISFIAFHEHLNQFVFPILKHLPLNANTVVPRILVVFARFYFSLIQPVCKELRTIVLCCIVANCIIVSGFVLLPEAKLLGLF